MLAELDATLGHRSRRYAHHAEARGVLSAGDLDGALQAHHGGGIETAAREPRMVRVGVAAAEGDEVHAGIAGDRIAKLSGDRGVGDRREHLEVTQAEHGHAVSRAGWHHRLARAERVALHREGRDDESPSLQRRGGGVHVGDEQADMVEHRLAGLRHLDGGNTH